jgi:hypothetical protein
LAVLTKRNSKILRKQNLPQITFFTITVICAGLLVPPLWNYAEFYAALYNFEYTVPGITINASQLNTTNTAQINFTLVLTNPTSYSGLRATGVTCGLEFYGDVHYVISGIPPSYRPTTLWSLTTLGSVSQEYTIAPNSIVTIPFRTTINPNSTTGDQQDAYYEFINYLRTQVTTHGQIDWSLTCTLTLVSFMYNIKLPEYPMLATPVG